ncbi:hypothetical protein IIB50_00465 [Patescibacteria group bacterium]|nr:hypothetical protein [Patescibacteria group bacterium]
MKKILLHNLSVKYTDPKPGLYNFDQLGLFFADTGDVVLTREKISDAYISFLENAGINLQNIKFISSRDKLDNKPDAIFLDVQITKKLASIIKNDTLNWILDSFVLTEYEAEWAKKIGLYFEGNPDHYYSLGSKSTFRSLAKKYNFSIPKGYEKQASIIDGAISTSLLFLQGFSEVVVKQDEGVAGLGSQRITRDKFLSHITKFNHLFTNSSTIGVTPTHSTNFIVEVWYADVTCSPSIQLHISSDGKVELLSTHIQLLNNNKMRYIGCLSNHWLDKDLHSKVETEGIALARIFSKKRYRGHLAFNAIYLKDKRLMWTEINPRRVISSYPFQIRKRLYGEDANKKRYISKQVIKSKWCGKSIEYILDVLSSVLFTSQKMSGIVPFDYGLLHAIGQLSLVGFGTDADELNEIFKYVDSI